jgi:hypothetical protein
MIYGMIQANNLYLSANYSLYNFMHPEDNETDTKCVGGHLETVYNWNVCICPNGHYLDWSTRICEGRRVFFLYSSW